MEEHFSIWPRVNKVKSVDFSNKNINDDHVRELFGLREPILISNAEIGQCKYTWTPEYLIDVVGNKNIKVHVCPHLAMNFLEKNFMYKTMDFSTMIKRASAIDKEYFIEPQEVYYYRALGINPRGKDVANLSEHFPEISSDFAVPSFLKQIKIFSSVLRVSSAKAVLWTHYDVMDNILIQIVGKKRVILFPPNNAFDLYLEKDKSKVVDLDDIDVDKYPKMKNATPYKVDMNPGDCLFIPALWFHNVVPYDFSVAVNLFWKNLIDEFYDKNDPYGNHDLLPAAQALMKVDSAVKQLSALPSVYKDFYARRIISKMENLLLNE